MSFSAAAGAASAMTAQKTRIGRLVGTLLLVAYSAWAMAAFTGHVDSPLGALVDLLEWADAPTTDVDAVQSWMAPRPVLGLLGAVIVAPLGISARQGILIYGGLLLAGETFGLWRAGAIFLLATAVLAACSLLRKDGNLGCAWDSWLINACFGGLFAPVLLLLSIAAWLTEAYMQPESSRRRPARAAASLAKGHGSLTAMPAATAAKVLTLSMAASRDLRSVDDLIFEAEDSPPTGAGGADPRGPVSGS